MNINDNTRDVAIVGIASFVIYKMYTLAVLAMKIKTTVD